MGDSEEQISRRCRISSTTRREIVNELQKLFDWHNDLIRLFRTALDHMPSDDHVIVIHADKTPAGEHSRRFNAPTTEEVANVIAGTQFKSRYIVLHRRDGNLQRVP